MKKQAISPLKQQYMDFFQEKLNKYEVDSPAQLDEEGKKKFFNEIEKEWTKDEKKSDLNVWSKLDKVLG